MDFRNSKLSQRITVERDEGLCPRDTSSQMNSLSPNPSARTWCQKARIHPPYHLL